MLLSVKIAKVCLHLSTIMYLLAGLLIAGMALLGMAMPSPQAELQGQIIPFSLFWGGAAFVVAAVVEYIARGLQNGRAWAWWSALLVFSLYLMTAFVPLGLVGILALFASCGLFSRTGRRRLRLPQRG